MHKRVYILLPGRGVVRLGGPDRVAFLQGLVSNDVAKAGPERAVWAALLTAQGRFLHEFFVVAVADALLLDCESARAADLVRRLSLYRLRAQVEVADASSAFAVAAVPGERAAEALGLPAEAGAAREYAGGTLLIDPRLAAAGGRAVLPAGQAPNALEGLGLAAAPLAVYERLRLDLGLPDGSRDLGIDKALLLESGFEELNGVDFAKGCYMGQELTARTKYRALVKKRLLPVAIEGPLPPPGTPIAHGTDEVGEMRSGAEGRGLALIRLDRLAAAEQAGAALTAGEARLTVRRPGWLRV